MHGFSEISSWPGQLVASSNPAYIYTCAYGVLSALTHWAWEITAPDDDSLVEWQLVIPHDDGYCQDYMDVFEQYIKIHTADW